MSDDGAELNENEVQRLMESRAEDEAEHRRQTTRPLDVYDIAGMRPRQNDSSPAMGDHWYWCRKHQRPEHVGWTMVGCVRIGPFMSAAEAERLAGAGKVGMLLVRPPLGMEVEW